MNKKNYVKPDIKVYDIEKYPMLICTSSVSVTFDDDTAGGIGFGNNTEEGDIISID
ncbi:MAG: hypothetical protein PUB65_00440 [Prevotellaceae bacterium]|nr:hypothetical protein [Prevotellaceae bacterium]